MLNMTLLSCHVTKKLSYALWENNSGSNLLRESSASCEGLFQMNHTLCHRRSWQFQSCFFSTNLNSPCFCWWNLAGELSNSERAWQHFFRLRKYKIKHPAESSKSTSEGWSKIVIDDFGWPHLEGQIWRQGFVSTILEHHKSTCRLL